MASAKAASKKKMIKNPILLLALLIIALVPAIYFYNKYQQSQNLLKTSTQDVPAEVDDLINKIGKLILLPENEIPTIATVSDKNVLNDQPFFKNAQNKDKVLIYQKSGKAILYRSSINKIIEVSSINLSQPEKSVSPSSILKTEEKNYKLVLYNATNISGLTKKVEVSLKENNPNIEVVGRGNAKGNYEKTLIVDLKGSNQAFADELAKDLKGEVGELPEEEISQPGVDFLIILANDFWGKF